MSNAAPLYACPGCAATPPDTHIVQTASRAEATILSVPGISCAACINGVESALLALSGVKSARVNLSLKRVTVDAPAIEPETLIDALSLAGYDALPLDQDLLAETKGDPVGSALLLKLAVAGFAMMNVMLFSVAVWSGASQATQTMFNWLSAAIALPALFFSARVFTVSGWGALKAGRLNMDVPISLAIILAAGLSLYETAEAGTHVYFDAALSLTFFLLVGRYLDHRTRMAARSASQELTALEAPRAILLDDGQRRNVNVADLSVGDRIMVLAGMRVPVDGIVRKGRSDTDRSLLSGESRPVSVHAGDSVVAGEMNLSAPLTLEVTATGKDTTLQRMAALVAQAEGARNKYTALADRAARIYAPGVHLLALLTFIGWIAASGDIAMSLNIAISVLIITCPCALGLAVPAVVTAATGRLFRQGLLVKDSTALERLAEVDKVVFDKTGTLTQGQAKLDLGALDQTSINVLKALAQTSSHPVSAAIHSALPRDVDPAALSEVREHPGLGIEATWNGKPVRLGRGTWLGCDQSPAFRIGDEPVQAIQFTETLRSGAASLVESLDEAGLMPQIMSGDTQSATDHLARRLHGIPARGDILPNDKCTMIQSLTQRGRRVLMIGDGLNDTAALKQAHASISPAAATDASRAASDIVVLGEDLSVIADALDVARAARRRVLENFAIAAGYNMLAIPVAVMGFATPLSAAIAMSLSSITVLLNALRVR